MALHRKITNTTELKAAIAELESTIKVQESELKANFVETKENLRPQRVLKNTFSYLAETPEVQKILVNTVVGFILGYASKRAAEVLNEDTLNPTIHNIVSEQLAIVERERPEGLLAKSISLFRKHTPINSPIYPYIKIK